MDLASYSDRPPSTPTRVIFLHGEEGAERLADEGPERPGVRTHYASHPNGGYLRYRLETHGYEVHEAFEGCAEVPSTGIFAWPTIVRTQLDRILHTDHDDALYMDDAMNQVVVLEPSSTSHALTEHGVDPGDPGGPVMTMENVKAVVRSLFSVFERHPEALFLYVVPPPLAPHAPDEPLLKRLGKALFRHTGEGDPRKQAGELSLEMSEWLSSRNGAWAEAPTNVAIFDGYSPVVDLRTGLSKYSVTPSDDRLNADGNRRIAEAFVPFLARALSRAGGEP